MFRPCIDLHEGKVKQIVGASLTGTPADLRVNFVSDRPARWFAALFKRDGLRGGHLIMLGPGNEAQARDALAAFPGGLQAGGGINPDNAPSFLQAGASHVIVTSWVFRGDHLDWDRLRLLSAAVGKNRLVLDLSCRKKDGDYFVVTNHWQKFTALKIQEDTLARLAEWCDEFLVHAADVEGLCRGVDLDLVGKLNRWSPIPLTYAGGANSLRDLQDVSRAGGGKIHLTIGSALDIFGGSGVRYDDLVAFNRQLEKDHK
ncbi:MAG: phosphoribosylformimino-5-aminoimidazole carboxamide ribotide isomerase [Verrucomicrobiota bacterium]|jgi:phosphoribosylformimino-5-aminoimidazole carboxamide ribotide isomerase